jgi:RimJ/RimL family protein N-acetyltransferase
VLLPARGPSWNASPPEPPLSDGVVTLRLWRDEDVPAIAAACREEEIVRWLDQIPQPYREEDARAWLGVGRQAWARGDLANFAIVDAETDEVLGSISARWTPQQRVGEIGYWVKRETRGRGAATRALRLISRWAIEEVCAELLELRADELNEPSKRVAEKAGFRREGVLRSSHYNPRQDRRVDFVMYSLLPGELG